MSDVHFEPATLSDGSVLSVSSGVVRRGAHELLLAPTLSNGRFIVAANQQRAVLAMEHGFEVFDLRDGGLRFVPRGEQLMGASVHYALSNDGALLATLAISDVAKLVVRSLDGEGRSTHELRLQPPSSWPHELGLSLGNEGAVTIALPWAAHSIPMSPKPPDVITFAVPVTSPGPGLASTARFSAALAARTTIDRLGDVALRYEPSMLIGETEKPKRSVLPQLAWTGGFALLLFALAALLLPEGVWLTTALLVLAALSMAAAVRLDRHEKRQRRFVANFLTYSLRLDFTSPIAGKPRTIVVAFDDVKDLQLVDAGGSKVLVVEFVHEGARLQEALVAFITPTQQSDAERIHKVLHGAFGLGDVPADSPIHGFDEDSSFS
ncbi:MAG: hypothetical protein ACO1OB_26685 [Archangium sp.]